MNSEDDDNNRQDDGFESENNEKPQQMELAEGNSFLQDQPKNNDENKKQADCQWNGLPPGQGLTGRKYSLFPDIATGWMPKDSKCHPIPITVNAPILDSLYQRIYRRNAGVTGGKWQRQQNSANPNKNNQSYQQYGQNIIHSENHCNEMVICYFGPRYDNTYYAWYQMPFQFPYTHIEPPTNMKLTNRPFSGQHPTLHHFQPGTLKFDSFFQNGNLDCAIKVAEQEYDLYLRVDSNTRGHFQWFNFTVSNLSKGLKYKFNICNLQKDDSLYQRGMKPYMFSFRAKEKFDKGWSQEGENIKYDKKPSRSLNFLYDSHSNSENHKNHEGNCKLAYYFKLSFEYSPAYDNDTVQMAYCIPYTFTDLRRYLDIKRKKNENRKYYSQSKLCLSLGGLPIPLITINQQIASAGEDQNRYNDLNISLQTPLQQGASLTQASNPASTSTANRSKKKCIVIGCRVHPGQSNASFMIQGLIDFLCSNKSSAKSLRNKIVFKIVPMLNPDGVCFGNYRTGLSGKDFNRQYLNPDARLFPEVFFFKKLVVDHKKKYGNNFLMFIDFHGHSVRKNVFMYGPQNSIMQKYYYESRIFPRILGKKTQMFRYYSCVFKIEQSKKTTARSIFQQMHNIPLSYTIQASNSSYYNTQILKDFPFTDKMWIQMGMEVGNGLFDYLNILTAAENNKNQKYKKLSKLIYSSKQENNLRTSKLIERKRQKKKGGDKIQDFNYGRIVNYQAEEDNYDEDLFKYIYQEIQQIQALKKKNSQVESKIFEQEEKIKQGCSDEQSQENDLQPQKLAFLHQAIKRKKFNELDIDRLDNKAGAPMSARQDKQLGGNFKNELIVSRTRSVMGNNQQQYFKRLSQPKKSSQTIINLSFQNSIMQSQINPLQIIGFKSSKISQSIRKNPKTFKDFVASYQKWERHNKDGQRPESAFSKSTISQQISISNQLSESQRNFSLKETNGKQSQVQSLMKKGSVKTSSSNEKYAYAVITKQIKIKAYESIEVQVNNTGKRRIYSPVKAKIS